MKLFDGGVNSHRGWLGRIRLGLLAPVEELLESRSQRTSVTIVSMVAFLARTAILIMQQLRCRHLCRFDLGCVSVSVYRVHCSGNKSVQEHWKWGVDA